MWRGSGSLVDSLSGLDLFIKVLIIVGSSRVNIVLNISLPGSSSSNDRGSDYWSSSPTIDVGRSGRNDEVHRALRS